MFTCIANAKIVRKGRHSLPVSITIKEVSSKPKSYMQVEFEVKKMISEKTTASSLMVTYLTKDHFLSIPVAIKEIKKNGDIYFKGSFTVSLSMIKGSDLRLSMGALWEPSKDVFVAHSLSLLFSDYLSKKQNEDRYRQEKEEKDREEKEKKDNEDEVIEFLK